MNCSTFQDQLSDYLEGALDARGRAEGATHRLICRECRDLYNEVRATMTALGELTRGADVEIPATLNARILAATTPGEMLNCHEFDALIERYFDGVLLAPEFQTFQNHFEHCRQCRRLLAGIEDAISLCREAKEDVVAVPNGLEERIVAVTTGKTATARLYASLLSFTTEQWAVALLILCAAMTLLSMRFASVTEFKAEAARLSYELKNNGQQARSQLQQATSHFDALLGRRAAVNPPQVLAPDLQPVACCQPLRPVTQANQFNLNAIPVATPLRAIPVRAHP
jgi:predicted anti-sigma-YlaC factor YlaD